MRLAGCECAAQFAAGDDVDAGAELCKRFQHRLIGIGLHGVTNHRVHIRESACEHLVVAFQRCRGIDVEGRADRLSDLRHGHVFGVQHAVDIAKMVHGFLPVREACRE